VFEPDDEYKGDFARTYFYMATRYADKCSSWGYTFGKDVSGLTYYGVALFMKWHRQDPVSQKEKNRNDAVYTKQNNRNPFIDYPDLAEHIWGSKKNEAWYSSQSPVENITLPLFEISPNPAKDYITISSETTSKIGYRIFDLSGKTMLSGETQVGAPVAINSLNNGIYLIMVDIDERMQLQKFIVNK
ncbi:MAG TPA: endonuclease, partial [Paludibacteraceae bacterium]|nr:endonuclease [Paludibacteraceae bacterium]